VLLLIKTELNLSYTHPNTKSHSWINDKEILYLDDGKKSINGDDYICVNCGLMLWDEGHPDKRYFNYQADDYVWSNGEGYIAYPPIPTCKKEFARRFSISECINKPICARARTFSNSTSSPYWKSNKRKLDMIFTFMNRTLKG